MTCVPIRRALLSVSDKLGLIGFAQALRQAGVELVSTGGTRRHLAEGGVESRDLATITGWPEMMDGRVKTLHPAVFGGILFRRDHAEDRAALDRHQLLPFDLVVVNLYPFAATARRPGVGDDELIEQIDIGGPSLVRAAAKNSAFVTVATSPRHYGEILEQVQNQGGTSAALRRRLMIEAFQHTAAYDQAIADHWSGASLSDPFPAHLTLQAKRRCPLRYGENSHQAAALYRLDGPPTASIVHARQLHGKELSYNNILDLDAALAIVRMLAEPASAVVKHNNPCGAATRPTLAQAAAAAFAGDPQSAFGSVVGFNRTVDEATADELASDDRFVEAIVAPDFTAAAVGVLTTRPKWKKNVRLLQVGRLLDEPPLTEFRSVVGGLLAQQRDNRIESLDAARLATSTPLDPRLLAELAFGWTLVRAVKSNAITLSRETALCGVGAGQMSRVDAVEIAIRKAGRRAAGCVLASDAFFPFPDSIRLAAEAGVAAIVQPGGSVRDDEVVEACNQHRIPMLLTGTRHFKH